MRYFLSRLKQDREQRIYRIYVTDSLFYHGQNKTLTERFADVINPKPKETKTASEIVDDVTSRMGIQVV